MKTGKYHWNKHNRPEKNMLSNGQVFMQYVLKMYVSVSLCMNCSRHTAIQVETILRSVLQYNDIEGHFMTRFRSEYLD